jgi:hypothetical protein
MPIAAFLPYTMLAPTGRAVAIRAQGPNPQSLLGSLREQMRQLDPEVPLSRPIAMTDIIGEDTKQPRFNMALFSFFGGLGLSLAVVGIFSVLSYSVVRRTHEIGVRMALGADRSHVLTLILSMGAKARPRRARDRPRRQHRARPISPERGLSGARDRSGIADWRRPSSRSRRILRMPDPRAPRRQA